jgi:hypothetical protein
VEVNREMMAADGVLLVEDVGKEEHGGGMPVSTECKIQTQRTG